MQGRRMQRVQIRLAHDNDMAAGGRETERRFDTTEHRVGGLRTSHSSVGVSPMQHISDMIAQCGRDVAPNKHRADRRHQIVILAPA